MDKNKSKKLTMVAIIAFTFLIVGASYAYLTAQTLTGKMTDINVTSYTTDVLTFASGDAISVEADQTTFGMTGGSVGGSTYASALLTANNKTNNAVEHYYLYLNIENNTFTYSVQDGKPELIMTITDKDGNEVKNIERLTYTEVTDRTNKKISGYDITTKNGLVTIFNHREIIAEPKAEDKWNITITFVNYEENQNANTGKALSAKLIIQKESFSVAKFCKNGQNLNSCIMTMNGKDNTLYHHDGTLENGINDNSYRYAGASDKVNNYVCFGTDESPCPNDNLYRIIGVFDHKISETQTEQRVKLIKYDYATSDLLGTDGDYQGKYTFGNRDYKGSNYDNIASYYWNRKTHKNTWSESNLNKINLNTNFINNIGKEWADKIVETTWKVGGNTYDNFVKSIPSVAYQNEIVNPVTTNTTDGKAEYKAKVGLMYISDYVFAADPSAWTTILDKYYNGKDKNWMHMGLWERTISRRADNLDDAFILFDIGSVNDGNVYGDYNVGINFGIRPSFSLSSSTTYKLGQGTATDPIRINWLTDSFKKISVKPKKNEIKSLTSFERFTSFFEL